MKFKHSGDIGDVLFSLPTVKALVEQDGTNAEIFLRPCEEHHPFGGSHFGVERIKWLMPLIEAQPYVASVGIWGGEPVDVDLDLFRRVSIDYSMGHIPRWYTYAFRTPPIDFSKPWLVADPIESDLVIVNRTRRYRNPVITNYSFLPKDARIGFVGLQEEFDDFKATMPQAERVEVADALELAGRIAGCRYFVGNQSCAYAMAEGLQQRRVLEVCPRCPNVIPHGSNGLDFVNVLGAYHAIELCESLAAPK